MKTREELHEYWRNPEEKNSPKMYINHPERTDYLVEIMRRYAKRTDSILELGCNVGRNIYGLWECGYNKLSGIEINKDAIDLMKVVYFDTVVPIDNDSIENALVLMIPECHDVVFSMCTLMHIHPDSNFVFEDIARVAKKCILTIEDEVKETWRHCPRNYKKVFEPFGFEQVFTEIVPWGENGCVTRVLKRVAK